MTVSQASEDALHMLPKCVHLMSDLLSSRACLRAQQVLRYDRYSGLQTQGRTFPNLLEIT